MVLIYTSAREGFYMPSFPEMWSVMCVSFLNYNFAPLSFPPPPPPPPSLQPPPPVRDQPKGAAGGPTGEGPDQPPRHEAAVRGKNVTAPDPNQEHRV